MEKYYLKNMLLGFVAVSLLSCAGKRTEVGDFHVIPLPQEVDENPGSPPFIISSSTTICYPEGNEKMERTAHFLASYIKEVSGTNVNVATSAGKDCILLELDSTITNKEGYELAVTPEQVILKGATEAGVFYGIQTIHKALPLTKGSAAAALPSGTVRDYPRFGYRGFMVDVCRHFFPVDYVKELIDMLALHNINYFHWHLSDDQGWRIEIKKYPRLTEIGSYRKETIVSPGAKEYDGIPVSGYYTREEAEEIVRYAADRFITVIPEIDMPGHMLAALASYPELGCTGGPYEIPGRFGVFDDVLCGGNERTLQFAKDVLEEIMDIFPSEYIHIGGDECPKVKWRACPKCQAKIRELGLRATHEHTSENQLQAYFMGEVEKTINARGRKMLGWDEILEGNPTKTSIVMAWTGVKGGVKAAQLQHQTIVCPISHLYFSNPGYNRLKGVTSIARVYNFEPVFDVLNDDEKKNIMGTQGCIWTEWTKDSVKMEWQMMPRISALSELQWTEPEKKNLDNFLGRLRHQLDLYTLKGYHYKQDIEDVVIDLNPTGQDGHASVSMVTFDNAEIRYTLDGTEPDASSHLYGGPFEIGSDAVIRAVAVRNGKNSGIAEEKPQYNLATMRPVELHSLPEERFTYKGGSLLVDGLFGDDNYRSGRYIGIYGQDLDITVDLQEEREISSVFVNTYLVPGDYIFGLTGLEVYASCSEETPQRIASKSIPVLEKGTKNNIPRKEEISFNRTKARYVRIVGKITPQLPSWHPGAGAKTFLFVDEIGIN